MCQFDSIWPAAVASLVSCFDSCFVSFLWYWDAVVCLGCEIDVNGACPVACTARARHSATHQIIGASDKHALPTSDAPLAVAWMCAFLPVLDAACVSIASTGCPLFYDRSFPPWISE